MKTVIARVFLLLAEGILLLVCGGPGCATSETKADSEQVDWSAVWGGGDSD